MGIAALTGHDVFMVNTRIINNLADGNCIEVTMPTEVAKMKISKNGNVIYSLDNTGLEVDVTARIIIGSPDDKYLNSLYQLMLGDFSAFPTMTATLVKRVGDGSGAISTVTYQLSGGIFRNGIEAKISAEGDVDQSVSTYKFKFVNRGRNIA